VINYTRPLFECHQRSLRVVRPDGGWHARHPTGWRAASRRSAVRC